MEENLLCGNGMARALARRNLVNGWRHSSAAAQEPSPSPSPAEMEAAEVVVSATRTEILEEESPASVSVITSEDN